jgi:hypothetical protein
MSIQKGDPIPNARVFELDDQGGTTHSFCGGALCG